VILRRCPREQHGIIRPGARVQVTNGDRHLARRPEPLPWPDRSRLPDTLDRVLDGGEAVRHARFLEAGRYVSENPGVDHSTGDNDERDGQWYETSHQRR